MTKNSMHEYARQGTTPFPEPREGEPDAALCDCLAKLKSGVSLADIHCFFKSLFDTLELGILLLNEHGKLVYVNEALCGLLGASAQNLLTRHISHLVAEESQDELYRQLGRRKMGRRDMYEMTMHGRDGACIQVELICAPVYDDKCRFNGSLAMVRDVTTQKLSDGEAARYQHSLEELVDRRTSELQLINQELQEEFVHRLNIEVELQKERDLQESIFNHSPLGMVLMDQAGRFQVANQRVTDITGYTIEDTPDLESWRKRAYPDPEQRKQASRFWDSRDASNQEPMTFEVVCRDGSLKHLEFRANRIEDGRYIVSMLDVSDRIKADEKLRYLATHDPLTGLPNRQLFQDRLQQALYSAKRRENHVGLLYVDLDNFKEINDSLGHETGDRMLQEAGRRLASTIREMDTLARIGGDEFAVILPALESQDDARDIAARIIQGLASPILTDAARRLIGASIGISIYPDDSTDPGQLLSQADKAMYQAKNSGTNMVCFFSQLP